MEAYIRMSMKYLNGLSCILDMHLLFEKNSLLEDHIGKRYELLVSLSIRNLTAFSKVDQQSMVFVKSVIIVINLALDI